MHTAATVKPDIAPLTATPICECIFVTWRGDVACHNPATWWGISDCCGERGLYCDSCKNRTDGAGDFRYVLDKCEACGGRGVTWVRL
jgi:hypothetical protein